MALKFSFLKIKEISWLTEQLLASEEGLCFMELVRYLLFVNNIHLN